MEKNLLKHQEQEELAANVVIRCRKALRQGVKVRFLEVGIPQKKTFEFICRRPGKTRRSSWRS